MASFDISNKIDFQKFDNAVNVARKEIGTRFDFKDSQSDIELDQKNKLIRISSASEMKLDTVVDVLISRMLKQGIDPRSLDLSKEAEQSGKMHHRTLPVKDGIDKETAKKLVKLIKESGLKVQASIMDDMVRVSGKKIDELQQVIALVRGKDLGMPFQYVNMKS